MPQIGVKRRHRLDTRIVADLDDHAEIVGSLAILIVDGELAEIVLRDENLGRIRALRHHADMRVAK